eukprot:146113-Karenia_brevis.AAC.1
MRAFRRLSSTHFVHFDVGPNRATGGVVTLVAKAWPDVAFVRTSTRIFARGRALRSHIELFSNDPTSRKGELLGEIMVWAVHNFGLQAADVDLMCGQLKRDY